jgi:hypothetical protein
MDRSQLAGQVLSMTSTINTSIISILMTTVAGPISIVGVLVLVALLIQKEIANGSVSDRAKQLSQALNIGIVPLLLCLFW